MCGPALFYFYFICAFYVWGRCTLKRRHWSEVMCVFLWKMVRGEQLIWRALRNVTAWAGSETVLVNYQISRKIYSLIFHYCYFRSSVEFHNKILYIWTSTLKEVSVITLNNLRNPYRYCYNSISFAVTVSNIQKPLWCVSHQHLFLTMS